MPSELYNAEAGCVEGPPPPLLRAVQPNTCGAFHGSGPSNFNGKLHIFHGYIPAREGEDGGRRGGVVSRRRRLMMDCTSSSCASQDSHFTAEKGSGSFGAEADAA